MKDFWYGLSPVVAAFLRGLLLAVIGGILTGLMGFLEAYETPSGASAAFVLVVIVVRTAIEGAYDQWRAYKGKSAD